MTSSPSIRPTSPTPAPAAVPALLARAAAAAGLALLAWHPPAAAQERAEVAGVVTDAAGSALEGVRVEVPGTYWRTVTASGTGRFRLRLPPGAWTLRLSRIGYRTAEVELAVRDGEPVPELEVRLDEAPVELEGVTATGHRSAPFAAAVSRETARRMPALIQPDPLRTLTLVPGVSQPNDLTTRLRGRGVGG